MGNRPQPAISSDVVCIGELLWDVFSDGQRLLGGAPANVSYHLTQLGVSTQLISRVGSDELGEAARTELNHCGVSTAGLQVDSDLPTGTALVDIGSNNAVKYSITTPAAWDAIEPGEISPKRAVVFGTLAQRDVRTRATLRALAKSAAERIYDVNLRHPHTSVSVVAESLRFATVVKMNDEEAVLLAKILNIPSEPKAFAHFIMERYGPRAVCVTLGERGSRIATNDEWVEVEGTSVQVVDSIGAGDAFLAALVAGLLARTPWPETLARANQIGAWVASKRGAMPTYRSNHPPPDVVGR